ncbi:hypothetical protein DSO57_1024589 [Entomophthora muscae]|uniref:Uncharacterized protein n=1 Tax=Entomophthora muscae TaxID=34485 RepID=A0ACC2TQ12_9FUNG|nr:hypothetical protein DSO57_1024589 [Entomophthora muscae]
MLLRELPGDVGAFWRLAKEPDLSVYKSSQAFCLHGASKNDSPPFCLRFCHDPTYDPTIEEILDAFLLVLYGTETTFVPDLKSWNLSHGVFSSNPPPIQIASVRIKPPTSQAAPNSLPLGHSQGQDPLGEDLDWLAEIGNQFDSWKESSTVSANRQLAHGLSQGHRRLPSGISAEAGTLPVVLTLTRALQMQHLSLNSPANRGLCRSLELVFPSPIWQKLNAFVSLLEDIKHLIQQLWSLHPR